MFSSTPTQSVSGLNASLEINSVMVEKSTVAGSNPWLGEATASILVACSISSDNAILVVWPGPRLPVKDNSCGLCNINPICRASGVKLWSILLSPFSSDCEDIIPINDRGDEWEI